MVNGPLHLIILNSIWRRVWKSLRTRSHRSAARFANRCLLTIAHETKFHQYGKPTIAHGKGHLTHLNDHSVQKCIQVARIILSLRQKPSSRNLVAVIESYRISHLGVRNARTKWGRVVAGFRRFSEKIFKSLSIVSAWLIRSAEYVTI